MTRFWRDGHWRSGIYGSHWVEGHWVDRTDWYRASQATPSAQQYVYRERLTYESFANPNAHCPVCGAKVAFYQSPYGGKVYFNYLGWPWPKHECTDTGRQQERARVAPNPVAPALQIGWQAEGWLPINVERVMREDSWYVLKCKALQDGELIRALVPFDPGDLKRVPATLSPWSADGFATLSFLDDHGEPREISVCKYADYCLVDPREVAFPA
jgi:hypothetical protein